MNFFTGWPIGLDNLEHDFFWRKKKVPLSYCIFIIFAGIFTLILLLIKALIVGFVAAAPVGPIGFLCISRVLQDGVLIGFITGLGAASADGIYGCLGGLGVSAVANFMTKYNSAIRLTSAAILILLGLRIFFKKAGHPSKHKNTLSPKFAYFSAFFLTLTNPMTILSFAAIFAAVDLKNITPSVSYIATLILGVAIGSLLWWTLLTAGVGTLAKKIQNQNVIQWINRIAGTLVILLAMATLYY